MNKASSAINIELAIVVAGSIMVGVAIGLLIAEANWIIGLTLLAMGIAVILIGIRASQHTGAALDALSQALNTATDATMLPITNPLPPSTPLTPLGDNLTRIGQQMRHLIMHLQMQADQVRDVAVRIGEAAAQHNQSSAEQATAVTEVATAMTELDRIIASVTDLTHQVTAAASDALQETQSSERVVDAVVNSLNTTSERVSETATAMTRLRDRISQIGQISLLLADVAHDTHLLSLNAAIESASAGPYGVRFNIIAEEVYTLAARTREGSTKVSQLVQELDSALLTTEAAANAGLAQTSMTTAMTNVLTTATTMLTSSAQRTQQLATAIDQAMTQQRIGATQVSAALNNIADSARSMSSQSNAVANRASDLTTVADQLRQSALLFGRSSTADRAMRLLIAGRETVSQRGLAWSAVVDSWNQQHPNALIAIEFIPPGADYIPNLRLALVERRAPDIIHIPGNAEFGILALGDYLVPLDGLIKSTVRSDFYPQVLTPHLSDGHLYTLPTEAQPLVLFYSKKLFTQLGLDVPHSWDELIALGLRCRRANRWGIVMETGPGDFRFQHWLPFVWQEGIEITDSQGRLRLRQPEVQAALQFWHELFDGQQVAPLNPPYPSYDIANLADGHCAIQYIGTWGMNMLRESYPDFEYGIADLPLPANGQPATMLLTWGLAVTANSPMRDAAAEFVRWALASEGEAGVARVHSLMVEGLPVRRSEVALVTRAGALDPNWQYLLEQVYPHAHISPPLSDADIAAADKMIGEAISPS